MDRILSFPITDSLFNKAISRYTDAQTRWTPIVGDAGFRLYFRGKNDNGRTFILLHDSDSTQLATFVKKHSLLAQAGISVPRIYATDSSGGLALLEDFGDNTYLKALNPKNATAMYTAAWQALIKIQHLPKSSAFAPYNTDLLRTEMALFPQWYCNHYLQNPLNTKEQKTFSAVESFIIRSAVRQPQVVVHRDYHSRNLMLLKGAVNPGILDFQDAVIGPLAYDLVSLFRDAYCEWNNNLQREWSYAYWQDAKNSGLKAPQTFTSFWRQYNIIGAQRGLKVLGIFARLALRDKKHAYLKDMPLVYRHLQNACSSVDKLSALGKLLATRAPS